VQKKPPKKASNEIPTRAHWLVHSLCVELAIGIVGFGALANYLVNLPAISLARFCRAWGVFGIAFTAWFARADFFEAKKQLMRKA
jgi:hypothetical protein